MAADGFQVSGGCQLDERTWEGLEYLESVAGPGVVAEMIGHFRKDTPDRLARMRAFSGSQDAETLARLAHDLKSNCATLGLPLLAGLGACVEQAAESGNLDGADLFLDQLERFFPGSLAAIEKRASSFTSQAKGR